MTDIKAHQKACFAALVDGETLLWDGKDDTIATFSTWGARVELYPERVSIKPKVTRHYGKIYGDSWGIHVIQLPADTHYFDITDDGVVVASGRIEK